MESSSYHRVKRDFTENHPMLSLLQSVKDRPTENYFSLFPEELLASMLDAFVINTPMTGGVGGDGFWVHQQGENLWVAVFDCMGHGHLASIMTRIYTTALNSVISKKEDWEPGNVLSEVHEVVKARFGKKNNLRVGTGADMGLLKINTVIREMDFAGAKMNLLQVSNGTIETLKANRIQVGEMFEHEHIYTTQRIQLNNTSKNNFYLSSDGWQDLFGGPDGKKLGKGRIREFVEELYDSPMAIQKEALMAFVDSWKGSHPQLDDILIVGFSL